VRRFQTKPDIIVRRGADGGKAAVAIIDTKWKRMSTAIEDGKHGMSQADVYQMMAYGRLYGCPELVLLYPHHAGLGEGSLTMPYVVNNSSDRLHLRSLDVAQGEAAIVTALLRMIASFGLEGSPSIVPARAAA
jgi:5-methylcytosine-specific restriction enzyme subunit McrC